MCQNVGAAMNTAFSAPAEKFFRYQALEIFLQTVAPI